MDVFVGAEYIIANALIAIKEANNKDSITFAEIRKIGVRIQEICNQNGLAAVILTSGSLIKDAIYNFSDCFEYTEDNGLPSIRIKDSAKIENCRNRLTQFLPIDLVNVVKTSVNAAVAKPTEVAM